MAKQKSTAPAEELVQIVVDALHEKKANEIVSLDLRKIKDTVANFFVIAHGDSNTQVNALHHSVVHFSKDKGHIPYKIEGTENGEWIIVDFVDVVVHIFHRDKRDFYQLEELWNDAPASKHNTAPAKKEFEQFVPKKRLVTKRVTTVKKDDKIDYKLEEELVAKKTAERKLEKKENTKKAVARKTAAAKAPAKKAAEPKAPAKKTAATKVLAKKATATKAPAKKAVAKKTTTPKKAAKK